MNKAILSAAAVTFLTGTIGLTNVVSAQAPAPASGTAGVHKVGLIDMAEVFKKYHKFEVLREDLKLDIQSSEEEAKRKASAVKQLQEEMKAFKEGSPEYVQREQALTKGMTEFEAFRKLAQRDFLRKESQAYHTIYTEVTEAVEKYADYFKYTLVIRFNSTELDGSNPQELIQGMNRQVVFYREDDNITDAVVDYLNRKYAASGGRAPASTSAPPAAAGNPAQPARR